MEEKVKQQAVSYSKCIVNVPSEINGTDGELSVCQNMIADNGEMKPIQLPGVIPNLVLGDGEVLRCVHGGRYIFSKETTIEGVTTRKLLYKNTGNADSDVMVYNGELRDVTTVGNTVVASTTEEMHYALWAGGSYKDLGNKIPEPDVDLWLEAWPAYYNGDDDPATRFCYLGRREYADGIIKDEEDGVILKPQEWNDVVIGTYSELKKRIAGYKRFCLPFAVRVAVRLVDGTHVLHSSPRLFFPSYSSNMYVTSLDRELRMYMLGHILHYVSKTDYTEWSDVVSGVDVFLTRQHDIYKTDEDATYTRFYIDTEEHVWTDGFFGAHHNFDPSIIDIDLDMIYRKNHSGVMPSDCDTHGYPDRDRTAYPIEVLNRKTAEDIIKEVAEDSVFFKVCTIDTESSHNSGYIGEDISSETMKDYSANESLENDFHSHSNLMSGQLFAYNGRLNVYNAYRDFFAGFSTFAGINSGRPPLSYYVEYALNINGKWVKKTTEIVTRERIGAFMFYPDTRAKYVRVRRSDITFSFIVRLKEHPGLNGSYFASKQWDGPANDEIIDDASVNVIFSDATENYIEELENTLIVSEVDNPFTFTARGYSKIGNGRIIGMSPIAMALSEYNHGSRPLIVLATDGAWSLSVDSEGYYTRPQAISRDICTDRSSIVQVDNGMFFFSDKGLMYADTSGIKCVSEQMFGTDLQNFTGEVVMAYDYKDSLLHMVRKDQHYMHYVYNMKNGVFAEVTNDVSHYFVSVNNYPDTVIQDNDGHIRTMTGKPSEVSDTRVYAAELETRAMKFGNVLTAKSIRQMKHLFRVKAWDTGQWEENPQTKFGLTLRLYCSNDGYVWHELHSLKGKPWKFFKFGISLSGMSAEDRLSGTVVWTQERRTERLR